MLIFVSTFLATLWLSAEGSLCSDEGGYPVTDKDECRSAIPLMRYEVPGAHDQISFPFPPRDTDWPHGCFIGYVSSHKEMYFNLSPGRTQGNLGNRQVCKVSGK